MGFANITDRNMTKGLGEVIIYANEITNSWLSNLILFGIYIITLVSAYNYTRDWVEGMAIAGFLTFIVSLLFFLAGFISGVTLGITIAIAIISVVLLFFSKKR